MIKSEKYPRARDNICASTSRILSAGHAQLPVQQVGTPLGFYWQFPNYRDMCYSVSRLNMVEY